MPHIDPIILFAIGLAALPVLTWLIMLPIRAIVRRRMEALEEELIIQRCGGFHRSGGRYLAG